MSITREVSISLSCVTYLCNNANHTHLQKIDLEQNIPGLARPMQIIHTYIMQWHEILFFQTIQVHQVLLYLTNYYHFVSAQLCAYCIPCTFLSWKSISPQIWQLCLLYFAAPAQVLFMVFMTMVLFFHDTCPVLHLIIEYELVIMCIACV